MQYYAETRLHETSVDKKREIQLRQHCHGSVHYSAMRQSTKPTESVNLLEVLLESLARSFFVGACQLDVERASAGTETSLCLPLPRLSTYVHIIRQ